MSHLGPQARTSAKHVHAVTGTAVRRLETTLQKPVQGIVPAPGHGYNTTQHEHSYEPHTVCKKACALRGNATCANDHSTQLRAIQTNEWSPAGRGSAGIPAYSYHASQDTKLNVSNTKSDQAKPGNVMLQVPRHALNVLSKA